MKVINQHTLLTFLSDYLPANPVIIEAGAFNGIDTKKMAAFWPQGTIHAFEPVPEIFDALMRETEVYPNVKRYPFALSTTTGNALFYVAQHPKKPQAICQAGTLHKPKDRLLASPITYPHTITVKTLTLTDWAQAHAISQVDFIWLDMQGHELPVLQASSTFIKKASIIYLEVNFIAAYENQATAQEINAWMEDNGFTAIARDFADNPNRFFGNIIYRNRLK